MLNKKGFTLVEIIVVLAVLAILVGLAVPIALKIFERTAEDTTREEMDNIKKAMLGDPKKLQSSFRSDFGFLGDVGCLPTVLDRLVTQGSLPPWSFNSTNQAGAGWKGPYITGPAGEEFTKDQLGNPYTYTVPAGACPLTATLTSNGPDGQPSTADDISISVASNETTATVRGKVKDTAGVGLQGISVEFYSAVVGVLTTTTSTTDANGEYVFASVPFGARAVRALPRLVFSPGSVVITGGVASDISFKVVNYSTSSFQIDQLNANFGPAGPNPNYDEARINGTTVDSGNNHQSQETITLIGSAANRTIAASPVTRPSIRVVVDSFDTQLPDIVISGQGTAGTIEINDFNSNMTGTPFTVTFTAPASVTSIIKFTP